MSELVGMGGMERVKGIESLSGTELLTSAGSWNLCRSM